MAQTSKKDKDVIITTVAFDRITYRQLGHLAVDEETSVRELVRRAVTEYVERRTAGKKGTK